MELSFLTNMPKKLKLISLTKQKQEKAKNTNTDCIMIQCQIRACLICLQRQNNVAAKASLHVGLTTVDSAKCWLS